MVEDASPDCVVSEHKALTGLRQVDGDTPERAAVASPSPGETTHV